MPARPFFGLDIGTFTSKAVQFERSASGLKLTGWGQVATPKGLFSDSQADVDQTTAAIKGLLAERKITTNAVVASLPENQVFTRIITMSSLTDKELASAVRWQAEQYVPLPIAEVSLQYSIVNRYNASGSSKMDVLLIAAPLRVVNKYLSTLKQIGLSPLALETEPVALSRVVDIPEGQSAILLDIGATDSSITVLRGDHVFFTRTILTGGDAFSRAIASEFNIPIDQAREYKNSYGMIEGQVEGRVVSALKPVVGVILGELGRTIALYQNKVPSDTISRLILVGGSALMPGLAAYLAGLLGVDVEIADAFSKVTDRTSIPPEAAAQSAEFATAAGLAMRELK